MTWAHTSTEIITFLQSLRPVDYFIVSLNVLLFIFAEHVLRRFSSAAVQPNSHRMRVNLLRGLNIVILFVYAYTYLYRPSDGPSGGLKILGILAVLYTANITNFLLQYFVHKQYGKARDIGERTLYVETYQTRLLSILSAVFITIIAIVSVVHLLGFDSLLEAGGVIGIIGVFLGLTQSSWAPDIISGLIILNSDMLEEGDIIDTGDGILGRVYKTKLFHTEILNISNNHRIMIRNAHLRDKTIHNLSKFASAKGLRECLNFNIGYDTDEEKTKAMFEEAYHTAIDADIPIEENTHVETKVIETGDHAVTWGVLYHLKKVEKILSVRRDFREIILQTSKKHGIELSTPVTHKAR
ncbi:MAG: mechanosensitive ion channel family protein [Agarilytica sp.]